MKIKVSRAVVTSLQASIIAAGHLPDRGTATRQTHLEVEDVSRRENATTAGGIVTHCEPPKRSIAHTYSFSIPEDWDRNAERRFQELAEKEALGFITEEELADLEGLTVVRRRATRSERTAEEILTEMKQWRLTVELAKLLDQYVECVGAPSNAKKYS